MKAALCAGLLCVSLPVFAGHIPDELWPMLTQGSTTNEADAYQALVVVLHYGYPNPLRTLAVANLVQYVARTELDRPIFRQTFKTLLGARNTELGKAKLKAALKTKNLYEPPKLWERCFDFLKYRF